MLLIVVFLMTSSAVGLNVDNNLDILVAVKEKLNSGSVYLLRAQEPGEYWVNVRELYQSQLMNKMWCLFQTVSRIVILYFKCSSASLWIILFNVHISVTRRPTHTVQYSAFLREGDQSPVCSNVSSFQHLRRPSRLEDILYFVFWTMTNKCTVISQIITLLHNKLYYQQLHLKYLCNMARYWLQAPWGWYDIVETFRSVVICEIIVHLLVIVQNNKRWTIYVLK